LRAFYTMDKREKILQAAEKLFVENGFEGTSVRDLAKEASVNLAMISYYFGSKEKLLGAIVEHKSVLFKSILDEINQDDTLDAFQKMEKSVSLYVDRILSNRKFHLMLYRELSLEQRQDLHEEIVDIMIKNKDGFKNLIRDGIANGYFRKGIDIELVGMTIMGVINQCSRDILVKKMMFNDGKIDHQKLKERIKDYLREILFLYLK